MAKYRKVIQGQISAKIVLRKDKQLVNTDQYQTALRITHERKPRYYSTKTPLTIEDFQKIEQGKRLPENLLEIKRYFKSIEQKATELINELGANFTHQIFKERFAPTTSDQKATNFFGLFDERITELNSQEKISNAVIFKATLNALKDFDKSIDFDNLTTSKLKKFDSYLRGKGLSQNTISAYLSKIKYIYLVGIERGFASPENTPFGKRRYQMPALKATEKHQGLSKNEIQKLIEYAPINDQQEIAKDFFLLSLFCNGANLSDLLRLKYENIDFEKKEIRFFRAKTKSKNGKAIFVNLPNEAIEIIRKHKNKYQAKSNYVMDFLKPTHTEKEIKRKIHNLNNQCNNGLVNIAKSLDLPAITLYSARHTFANLAYQNTKDLYLVSKLLGHANITQTTTYLHSLGALQENENTKNILNL